MNWSNACNYDREVSFQGRLDKKLEKQKIKLRDNKIKLTSVPEDVIVVRTKKTVNGDTISKVISAHKLTNIIFPVLKDIPVRRISTEFREGYALTSMVTAHGQGNEKGVEEGQTKDLNVLTITVPFDSDLDVDDNIVRVFVQEDLKQNTVIVFNVLDIMSDYSNNAPLTLKAKIAVSTEPVDLDKPAYQMIMALAKRRLSAGY